MNCKQGDLAIVVRSHAGNEGKIVRCLELLHTNQVVDTNGIVHIHALGTVPMWRVDGLLKFKNIITDEVAMVPYCADSVLRPLRGDGLLESIITGEEVAA